MTLKISISGVRGLVPESLTPEVCLNFAKAFGAYLDGGKVVVGTDPRSSSEFIKGIIFSGLLSSGCEIIDLGICPTPTVGIMIPLLKACGGIIITASHNPLPWNGLKFMREDGIFLNEKQAGKLIAIYESKAFIKKKPKSVISNRSGIENHIKKILEAINPRAARHRRFRVALDCVNGAGSIAACKLLERFGARVESINCNLNRPFPHNPEPVPKNLSQLMKHVKQRKADIGFALDADADRLAIVSEEGKPIGEELTLALAVKFILSQNHRHKSEKKIVVTNLSTTKAIDDIVRQFGGTALRTKIGEVHVAEEIKNLKGLIGGEGNGGVIYPRVGFNRDSLTAMALILCFMAHTKKKISELAAEIPSYYMLKKKISCHSQDQAQDYIEKTKEKFRKKPLVLTEGVKVLLPDGWVHVRASNTEPILRIIAESKIKKAAQKLIQKVMS